MRNEIIPSFDGFFYHQSLGVSQSHFLAGTTETGMPSQTKSASSLAVMIRHLESRFGVFRPSFWICKVRISSNNYQVISFRYEISPEVHAESAIHQCLAATSMPLLFKDIDTQKKLNPKKKLNPQ